MIRKILIFFAIFSLCIGAASASQDIDDMSDVPGDSIDSICADEYKSVIVPSEKSFESIQDSINSADSGDTISIDGYYSRTKDDGMYAYGKDINFEGKNNAVLDAKKASSIFSFSENSVVIKNIHFKNAKENAISMYNGKLTLESCVFEATIGEYGSAVEIGEGSSVFIKNCRFINNNVKSLYVTDNFSIEGCKFENNKDSAIIIFGSHGKITNCEFSNNNAKKGSAILADLTFGAAKDLKISNCMFKNSKNPVFLTVSDLTVENSHFISNTYEAMTIYGLNQLITGCEFTKNTKGSAIHYGGASFYSVSKIPFTGNEKFIVKNSVFTGNSANDGAAICYEENSISDAGNIKTKSKINLNEGLIDNCVFKNNEAKSHGGAIEYLTKCDSNVKVVQFTHVKITNCQFTNCKADRGGAVYIFGADNTISKCTFTSNRAEDGGAVYVRGNNFKLLSSSFKNSYASYSGGAVSFEGSKLTVKDSKFVNSKAKYEGGGAVYAKYAKGSIVISNSKFIKSKAENGGAIVASGNVKIDKCQFKSNTANRFYAAVYTYEGKISLTKSKFTKNKAPFGIIKTTKKYKLSKNKFSKNSKGVFFIGKTGHYKILTSKYKKVALIKCKISKSGGSYKIKLTHKYLKKPVTNFGMWISDSVNGDLFHKKTNSKGIVKFSKSKISGRMKLRLDEELYNYETFPKR